VSLWLRFSDESALPSVLPKESALRLERELDPHRVDSLLSRAFRACGLRPPSKSRGAPWTQFIPWNELRVGYLNASLWVETLSCGMSSVEREEGGSYRITPRFRVLRLPQILRVQWRLSALLAELDAPVPLERRLERSLTLGIALQLVQMRLPPHSPRMLAEWLAVPAQAPRAARKTLALLSDIQSRRSTLSGAWAEQFQTSSELSAPDEFPEYFWDQFRLDPRTSTARVTRRFEGSPVFPGAGEGVLQLRSGELALYPVANPDAPQAVGVRALFFCRGGVLSHACVLAREKKIPCITGLGSALEEELRMHGGSMRIRFDAGQGWVECI
jgi:hypothetical protein